MAGLPASTLTKIPPIGLSATRAAQRRHRSARSRRETIWFYLLISPWIFGFLAFLLGPMITSLYFSFTSYDLLTAPEWIGVDNYTRLLFRDPLFWQIVGNTLFYAVGSVLITTVLSVALAVLLNTRLPGIRFFQTIMYLPALVPVVATAMLFSWVLAPDTGLLNRALSLIGIEGPAWLLDAAWVKPALILMSLWGLGNSIVLMLAGLKGLPTEVYEAARLDGVNRWQEFRHITLPLISPVILFNVIVGLIASFQVFAQVYILTEGGPNNASEMLLPYIYDQGFQFNRMGYASALSWVLFIIILIFTALVFRTSTRWVFYETDTRP